MRRFLSALVLMSLLNGCLQQSGGLGGESSVASRQEAVTFGAKVTYSDTPVNISAGLGADFPLSAVTNMAAMEEAYGFTFTAAERRTLEENKFIMKPLLETSIRPRLPSGPEAERFREFLGLYNAVRAPAGANPHDFKERTQANALFLSSDIFFHAYNLLYTELLKEMENTVFFPDMKELAGTFYEQASAKVDATSGMEQEKWRKVRNYFVVPYALLSSAQMPLTRQDYYDRGGDPAAVLQAFNDQDKTLDTLASVTAFVKNLGLDAESEAAVLADLASIYAASSRSVPTLFAGEYDEYRSLTGVMFQTDFTQFTPRSHYTSSSLRRQYFRSMMWFSQIPFFVRSPALTEYAFAMSQLLAENPQQLADYNRLESAINFLVGSSDDLMPADYLAALESAKGSADPETAIMQYLITARPPRIKSIPALYGTVGDVESEDVLLATKGMRFFSGKFIIDSYWTGQLTQGDEAPKPGYTQKLPPMASSLEVMALLGSDYAREQIPTLDFYTPETREAIDQAMAELTAETAALDDAYWRENLYTGWLWTIRSLFSWQKEHRDALPAFMQSETWPAKTLMTAAGFWTELRHATLLYAKQSFAELGGGPGACDTRQVPLPPKGYIEPQIQAYDRLHYLAERTWTGLQEQGFDTLRNFGRLQDFLQAVKAAQHYAAAQLENAEFTETITQITEPDLEGNDCVSHTIEEGSDWEMLRTGIVDALIAALPEPVEGPVLPAKDKRAALVADVHTGGDSLNPHRILYEGNGVPHVIFVAVNDRNGPRLTVGFTYAQYEFTEPYGGPRLTDELWQKRFYEGEDPYEPFNYTPLSSWPEPNPWYEPLFP